MVPLRFEVLGPRAVAKPHVMIKLDAALGVITPLA